MASHYTVHISFIVNKTEHLFLGVKAICILLQEYFLIFRK